MFRQDLAQLPIFQGFSMDQLQQLNPILMPCHYDAGCVIFKQDQPAANLYILTRGHVEISFKPYDGPALVVANITPGGVFGWSAAMGRDSYTSSAVAREETDAVRITSQNLQSICEQYPETGGLLLERLAGVISERLRTTHTQILSMLSQGMELGEECQRRMNNGSGQSKLFNR